MSANIGYSNSIGSIYEDYTGYIMNTYRNMNRSDGLLSHSRDTYTQILFNYRNPFTTLFSSMRLFYNNRWRNMLYDIAYNGILSSSVGVEHPNSSNAFGVYFSVGQSIDAINSEVRLNAGFNQNESVTLIQGEVADYNSASYSVSPGITTDIGGIVILRYGATYTHTGTKIRGSDRMPVNYFTQDIATSFIASKELTFTHSFNHYLNSAIESSDRSLWFGNLGVRYKMKKVDWMLDWTNVFNTRQFVTYSYSDISSYYSVYDLRPSELMLRVRFKIL